MKLDTGQIISGVGHLGLIGWILFGAAFSTDTLPFDATQVTAVTSEEYAAILSRAAPPEQSSDISAPEAPDVPQDAPDLSSEPDRAPETPQPDATSEAAPDTAP